MKFKAIVAQYPVLDVTSPFFSERFDYDKKLRGVSPPDAKVLEEHLQHNKAVVTGDESLSRMALTRVIINEGKYFGYLSRGANSDFLLTRVQPIKCLELPKKEQIPFMFVYHGNQDSAVPVEGTIAFEKRMKELFPEVASLFVYQDGEHGFDRDATLDDEWLKHGLAEVGKHWPDRQYQI
jgi:acetyl esterase/lipase